MEENGKLNKLAKELLTGADKCAQKPYFIVQPFLGIIKDNADIVNTLLKEKEEDHIMTIKIGDEAEASIDERCKKCGQVEHGQTGEYPCPECGLPTVWDESADGKVD